LGLWRENEAAAFIDVARTEMGTAQEFRTQYAPNMAKLVALAHLLYSLISLKLYDLY